MGGSLSWCIRVVGGYGIPDQGGGPDDIVLVETSAGLKLCTLMNHI